MKFMCVLVVSVSSVLFSSKFSNQIELKNYIFERLPAIHGWCSKEKANAMIDLILEVKPKVCVEIGVFGGSSVFPTALALQENSSGKVWAIDPWVTDECLIGMNSETHRNWWSSFSLEEIYIGFCSLIAGESLSDYCVITRATSNEALKLIPKFIDILHIDGNHSEESAFFDATNYIPKVKSGGYIWFDDVHWNKYPDQNFNTKKALDYSLNHCKLVKIIDNGNCILLKKI